MENKIFVMDGACGSCSTQDINQIKVFNKDYFIAMVKCGGYGTTVFDSYFAQAFDNQGNKYIPLIQTVEMQNKDDYLQDASISTMSSGKLAIATVTTSYERILTLKINHINGSGVYDHAILNPYSVDDEKYVDSVFLSLSGLADNTYLGIWYSFTGSAYDWKHYLVMQKISTDAIILATLEFPLLNDLPCICDGRRESSNVEIIPSRVEGFVVKCGSQIRIFNNELSTLGDIIDLGIDSYYHGALLNGGYSFAAEETSDDFTEEESNYVLKGKMLDQLGNPFGLINVTFPLDSITDNIQLLANSMIVTSDGGGATFIDEYYPDGETFVSFKMYNDKTCSYQDAGDVYVLSINKMVVMWYCSNDGKFHGTLGNSKTCGDFSTGLDVNHYVYAALSLEVYNDQDDNKYLPPGRLPEGWDILTSSNDIGVPKPIRDGIVAKSYFNAKSEAVIFAIQGTNIAGFNAIKSLHDIINDWGLFQNKVPNELSLVEQYWNYTRDFICDPANNITVQYVMLTGHSLGAALAELASAKLKFSSVTFDSPGTKEILEKNKELFTNYEEALNFVNDNVITYNAVPDIINTMAEHVGTVYTVYPDHKELYHGLWRLVSFFKIMDELFYGLKYSFLGNHKMSGILEQFDSDTGFPKVNGTISNPPVGVENGYNWYKSYDYNTYYWDACFKYHNDWWRFIEKYLDIYNELNFTAEGTGVTIDSNDAGNVIWGTTNFDDVVRSGTGDDTHYLFGGNDYSYDKGGFDTYLYPFEKMGRNTISDLDGNGIIKVGNTSLSGTAVPIYYSSCPYLTIYDHVLIADRGNSYFLKEENNNLLIFTECDFNSNGEMNNSVTIENYNWGDFQISKSESGNQTVIVGADAEGILDCRTVPKKCIAISSEREQGEIITLITSIMQESKLVGSMINKLNITILKNSDVPADTYNKLASSLSSEVPIIQAINIKAGDVVDLTDFDTSVKIIKQNGTDCYLNIDGNQMHMQTNENYPYLDFTLLENNTISMQNQDMSKYDKDHDQGEDSGDNTGLIIGLSVTGSVIGIGLLALLGRCMWLKYYASTESGTLSEELV